MLNFQDLPDELVLKILSYSETKDLISCGQISKRIRRITYDGTLWVTANLKKKIVKAELLEMLLGKGCRNLNLCHSTIIGCLSSNIKSQLSVFKFSQPVCNEDCEWDCNKNNDVLEELLASCCSLQHLLLEGAFLTPKMAVSICKNGKTLQTLNLNSSFLDDLTNDGLVVTPAYNYLPEFFKCCQELKELNLAYVSYSYETEGLTDDENLEFLAKNIAQNVEKLNLSGSLVADDHVKILLSRCNKIKALTLEARLITDDSLKNIRQCLNLTLEELSLGATGFWPAGLEPGIFWLYDNDDISFTGFFGLKSMPRLKNLNLYYKKDDGEEIQNLRQHLPHLMIKGVLN